MGRGEKLDKFAALLEAEFEDESAVDPALVDAAIANLAEWARPLLKPQRYKCLYGGRGSGKSFACADALLIEGTQRPIRVLCAREFQNSIKESVHYLLKERIETLGLDDFYTVQEAIITATNGSQFVFKGVRHNVQSIKSMAGLTHCWIEEGQTISAESWRVLVPTIREEGSEIWVTFNPLNKDDCIYQEFVVKGKADSYIQRVNWDLNPHFPRTLDAERREMQRTDPDLYAHIWEGECWERSEAQVLGGKWMVDEFEPAADWDGPYHGADWGFGPDPTAAVRLWISDRRLYVEYESYAHHLEIDGTAQRWMADIPGIERYQVRADSATPSNISYLKRNGIPNIVGAIKGKGSVEGGIAFLRSFEQIVVHPRCTNFAQECRLYSYKVDRLSGAVLPDLVDKHNHAIDSARYALEEVMRQRQKRDRRARSISNW